MGDIDPKTLVQKYSGIKYTAYIAGAVLGCLYLKSTDSWESALLGFMSAGIMFQLFRNLWNGIKNS